MHINRKACGLGLVVLVCALCSLFAYHSAASGMMAGRPSAVAVVNLPLLLDGLAQRGDAEARIKKMRDDILAEAERRQQEAEALDAEIQGLAKFTEAWYAKDDEIMLETLKNQAWLRLSNERLDVESALSLQDLYRTIKRSVADLAAADGWDLILVDDSQGELSISPNSQLSREAQITQQMAARRTLFVSKTVDITDQLITRMNNAYQAGAVGMP